MSVMILGDLPENENSERSSGFAVEKSEICIFAALSLGFKELVDNNP